MRILPLTAILAGALALAPTAATAAPVHHSAVVGQTTQSRFGGRGFGGGGFRSTRRYPSTRYSNRYRGYPRRSFGRSLFRGVLQGLGIAYLAHMLFGLGAGGGSPLGLLLLLGLVVWFVSRRRRRRSAFGY